MFREERKISSLRPTFRKPGRKIDQFLIASIVFHMALLFVFSLITIESTKPAEEPIAIEFEEGDNNFEFNDFPQENETDEEVDTHRFSDKNRKVDEESVALGSPYGGGSSRPSYPSIPSQPSPPAFEPETPKEYKKTPEETYLDARLKKDYYKKTQPKTNKERLSVEDLLPDSADVARLDQPLGTTSDGIKREDTVSLNTREFKYYAYFSHIKKQIEMAWSYPMEAQENDWGGRLNVVFVIEDNGSVSSVKLLKSSGYEILDNAAIRAIKFASPFNPIPKSIGVERLKISASFEYITSLYGIRW
jgi:protein TonB